MLVDEIFLNKLYCFALAVTAFSFILDAFCVFLAIMYKSMKDCMWDDITKKELEIFIYENNIIKKDNDIGPPWIYEFELTYLNSFLRKTGENWMHDKWLPFWGSLGTQGRKEYLMRWRAPAVWRECLHEASSFDIRVSLHVKFIINDDGIGIAESLQ